MDLDRTEYEVINNDGNFDGTAMWPGLEDEKTKAKQLKKQKKTRNKTEIFFDTLKLLLLRAFVIMKIMWPLHKAMALLLVGAFGIFQIVIEVFFYTLMREDPYPTWITNTSPKCIALAVGCLIFHAVRFLIGVINDNKEIVLTYFDECIDYFVSITEEEKMEALRIIRSRLSKSERQVLGHV